MYSGKQLQDPAPLCSLHIALEPHGDGVQGVGRSSYCIAARVK